MDAEWHVLRDGTEVRLRHVRPDDKELLRRGFAETSPESRYSRFFTAKLSLSERELRYLTEVDGVDHVALGAAEVDEDGTERGLGVARFVRDREDPTVAEPAVAVIDRAQGKGLGTLLLRRLTEEAAERGIERFHCEVLAANVASQHMLRDIFEDVTFLAEEPGVLVAEIPIEAESLAQRMLAHVAQQLMSVQLGRRLVALLTRD